MAEKNKYGQYFTIGVIAQFMVSLISQSKDSRILEPSCGKGIFLEKLIENGYNNLSAYEIDSSLHTKYNDIIQYKSFLSVPTSEKYDVVIGNPPYIRWKNLESELKEELTNNELWNKYFNSLCDYLFVFILKSIEHLKENGELIFICTDYWMNTTHSESLRSYMCEKGYFTEIFHFKETPLFEKVTASFVIFRFIKSAKKQKTIKLYKYNKYKGLPSYDELVNKTCFVETFIPHFTPNNRWVLASKKEQLKFKAFEEGCKRNDTLFNERIHRIGDFCDIGNGMVSGLDCAFQFKDEITKLNDLEKQALITVLKAKDLQRYKKVSTTKYIFIQEELTEKEFKNKYPYFVQHFTPYLQKLASRYSYNRHIPYWEFVFPRNQRLFERKTARIFIPCKERVSNKNFFRFCYADENYFATQDVTAILRKPNCKESLEYLLAYLNNERVFNWLLLNGIVKGEIVEFSEKPISRIPYRPINWKSDNEIQIHNIITEETKKYLTDGLNYHLDIINNSFNTLFYEQN